MPPHGRRRSHSLTMLLWTALLLISTASAASAVLGIDLGTEYIKAALVKPGIPLEIVLTKDSKRKEAAAVAFKPIRTKSDSGAFPERIYGGDALALSARFPKDVYPNLKPLLGSVVDVDQCVKDYEKRYPSLKMVGMKDRDTVGFKSGSFAERDDAFAVEELLAMQLQNIVHNAEAFAGKGSSIRDVVITIPAFYSAAEKRAVEVAANLADLRILALTTDGLSVGINYATSRTFPVPSPSNQPEYHLVYDMGAGSTTATVLRFQGKVVKDVGKFNKTIQEVQVLGVGWDRTLGGDALNSLIVEDMITQFADSSSAKALGVSLEQITEHGRTMAKLWKEAERVRHVLSANTETSSTFEGLYNDDLNFKYKVTRSHFEELATTYAKRVRAPLIQALEMAKLDLANIESLILHGGAVRTPLVQRELESVVGSAEKVRTNVNSDEAAVFGAAFKAAGISPSFRVKEIRAGDTGAYTAGISWISEGKEKNQKLFLPNSVVGAEKQVPFKNADDFTFQLYQQVLDGDTVREISVSAVQTLNLTTSFKELTEKHGCSPTNISTTFSIRLSPKNGLPEVSRGFVSCQVVESNKKAGVVDNMKGLFGFGSKKADQQPLVDDLDPEVTTTAPNTHSTTAPSVAEGKTQEPKSSAAKTNEKPKEVKKVEVISVGFSVNATGLPQFTSTEILRIKERMASFDASDRSRKLREETLNTLEAFAYKARDLVDDEGFVSASTEQQRAEIEETFKNTSEWLYEDGADADRDTLKSRLKKLRDLVDPVQKRVQEAIKRPEQIKMLQETLNQTQTLMAVVKEQSEKALAAALAASAASSESQAQTTAAPSSIADDAFAELDDETSTKSTKSTSTMQMPEMPLYSPEDLTDLSTIHESVQKWLDEKLAEQEKRSPVEEPAILTSELAAKSKELNEVVMEVLQKKLRLPPKVKSSNKPKTRKTKSAKKNKSSESTTSAATASPSAAETSVAEGVKTKSTSPKVQDEL